VERQKGEEERLGERGHRFSSGEAGDSADRFTGQEGYRIR
jgi:hypothetical protein